MAMIAEGLAGLSPVQAGLKRGLDIGLALAGLLLTWWLILIAALLTRIITGENGFFLQARIGRAGELFNIIKLRTMRTVPGLNSTITAKDDVRITRLGRLLRCAKLDELPQLVNVLLGQMSFVGPRPDVPGFANHLQGEDRIVLILRPGITGPATLYYRDEEQLLAGQVDPEAYNRDVIYPHKVELNKQYIRNYSLLSDIYYIWKTVFG